MGEHDVLRRFLLGDNEAYSLIYRMYVQDLFSYGRSFTRDNELLKDAIQDIFFKILCNRKLLQDVQNLKYFLFKSLKNRLIDLQKATIAKEELFPDDSLFSVKITILDDIIKEEERISIQHKIDALLNKLTSRQREAVCLRFIYEMEYDEIANLLNMNNPKSARNLVSRAIERLREENSDFLFLFLLLYFLSHVSNTRATEPDHTFISQLYNIHFIIMK